jgi:dihydroorotate dehydrogenase (NAD+) catalytic subunit
LADLSVNIGPLGLKNPIMPASGTFGWGEEMEPYVDISKLGAVVPKSITVEPKEGNPPPRTAETPCGMLNAIGLQNPGVKAFLKKHMPRLRSYGVPVVVSIAGFSIDEYRQLAETLEQTEGVAAVEVNISCPNVAEGGIAFGTKPEMVSRVVGEVRNGTRLPVIPKLTPNVENIAPIARAAEEAGANALTVANTLKAMAIDWKTRKPLLANVTGGLSGPAIKPHALYLVHEVSKAVKIPIIASGGIMSATDVLEFIICGATAVQIGTANFVDPTTCGRLPEELDKLLTEAGIERLSDLIGSLQE